MQVVPKPYPAAPPFRQIPVRPAVDVVSIQPHPATAQETFLLRLRDGISSCRYSSPPSSSSPRDAQPMPRSFAPVIAHPQHGPSDLVPSKARLCLSSRSHSFSLLVVALRLVSYLSCAAANLFISAPFHSSSPPVNSVPSPCQSRRFLASSRFAIAMQCGLTPCSSFALRSSSCRRFASPTLRLPVRPGPFRSIQSYSVSWLCARLCTHPSRSVTCPHHSTP